MAVWMLWQTPSRAPPAWTSTWRLSEHSLDEGSTSRAASYVGLEWGDGIVTWGAGTDTDIIVAGIHALVSAINNK